MASMKEWFDSRRRNGSIEGDLEFIAGFEGANEVVLHQNAPCMPEHFGRGSYGWNTKHMFYAGRRDDGYAYFGAIDHAGNLCVLAGCQMWPSTQAARDYYNNGSNGSTRSRQVLSFIRDIESWGKNLAINGNPRRDIRKKTPARVDLWSVYKFMGPVQTAMFRNWWLYQSKHSNGSELPDYDSIMKDDIFQ